MKPEISEFSYGFALTHELIDSLNVKHIGAPVFPTLKQEGSKGGGYDVKLPGHPIFIQFKLSDILTRKNALDYGHFGKSYYRFKIWSSASSMQHELLLDLEKKYPTVYYAAPKFHTIREFNDKFVHKLMVQHSVFIKPSSIGSILDSKEHSVAFVHHNNKAIFRSVPQEVDIADFQADSNRFLSVLKLKDDIPTIEQFTNSLISIYENRIPSEVDSGEVNFHRQQRDRMDAQEFARYLSVSLFGSELLYVL